MSDKMLLLRMITKEDLKRIMGDSHQTEKIILNGMNTCKNASTDWAKNYWFSVWHKLCVKYDRMDLYRKHIH